MPLEGAVDISTMSVPKAASGRLGWLDQRLQSRTFQYGFSTAAVVAATVFNFEVQRFVGIYSIAFVFLLTVVLLALFVERGPMLFAAALSSAAWNYFFLPPVFAIRINRFEDGVPLGTYFVVALVLGQMTARIRAQERNNRQGEERALALYNLTRELASASTIDTMLSRASTRLQQTFHADVAIVLPPPKEAVRSGGVHADSFTMEADEIRTVDQILLRGTDAKFVEKHDKRGTVTYFVPLRTDRGFFGVMVLRQPRSKVGLQREVLDASAQQVALALDRQRLQTESENVKLLAESERLSKSLLNSISHEIRTPLAAIKGAVGNMLDFHDHRLSEAHLASLNEIQEAGDRLDRIVGKVLDITRLESGAVRPKLVPCDLHDLVNVAVRETKMELVGRSMTVSLQKDIPLVRADFVLLLQALCNLLSNSATHTPPGTSVWLHVRSNDSHASISVEDNGPGVPQDQVSRIFDKFYRGPFAPTGGAGLGLSIAKGFVEAQGGQVSVEDRLGGGAVFTLSVPLFILDPPAGKDA